MDRTQVSFGGYLFRPGPAVIRVESARTATAYRLPDAGTRLVVTGEQPVRVRLTGELIAGDAAGALEQYEALRRQYEAGGPEVLCVPGQEPFYALFTALTLTAEGDGRTLAYTAEFTDGGKE